MNVALPVELDEAARAFRAPDEPLARAQHGNIEITATRDDRDLWLTLRREGQEGGLAWRASLLTEEAEVEAVERRGALIALRARSPLGRHTVSLSARSEALEEFHLEVRFRPREDLHVSFLPRDLVVLGPQGPTSSRGKVEAEQRRLNTGLCFFSVDRPKFGKVLYLQDLTELGDYFEMTGTKPENAVGGEWPQLGYLPPTNPTDAKSYLKAGQDLVLSSAHLVIRRHDEEAENASAWQFLDMLGAVYRGLEKPKWHHRDWLARSRRTLRDLERSPKARVRSGEDVYFHPYTDSEYPDVMVQLSLLSAIREWSRWSGKRHPLEAEIKSGLPGFYDRRLKTMRRYLPDVGKDKDKDAVDSWYMYHPLMGLANLALDGDEVARDLFLKSVDYGIEAAHHFKYRWPIMFKVDTFKVIRAVTESDRRGQTDVGGMYAWVMLQAFELTGDARFLDEAKAAIAAAEGMRFDLNYQANLTAWGAAACIRLWRITGNRHYLAQSYVYLASFFHNAQIWQSRIGNAKHYSNFLAVTCLQDAPYMAIYECFDSFAAFERFLDLGGPDLLPAAKLLVTDYCRFALDRAWSYYPDALPKEALAPENRNGHIDRKLSFPLEDLYPDGQPAGQVGQEIYGAGAAMVFATRAFHRIKDAPFVLHCDHFIHALTRMDKCSFSLTLDGLAGQKATLSLIKSGRKPLPEATIRTVAEERIAPCEQTPDRVCFEVPANGPLVIAW